MTFVFGCGGDPGAEAEREALKGHRYRIDASLVRTPDRPGTGTPAPAPPICVMPAKDQFRVAIDSAAAPRLIVDRRSASDPITLVPAGNGWSTQGSFELLMGGVYEQGVHRIVYETFVVQPEGTGVVGSVAGWAECLSGDVGYRVWFAGTIAGALE